MLLERHPMTSADPINSVLELKGRHVWSVAPTAVVFEAIRMMSSKSVGALLVMSDGHLYGIVSERDYARKIILRDRSSRMTQVREIMSAPDRGIPRDLLERAKCVAIVPGEEKAAFIFGPNSSS